ncbi:phosphatase PAP2 family protein [Azorhizobium doebereinerae]|uniref:phosphatase PAP2 family protein n=1 Tax=Azorhizobium doebereinerae TaxID=281091 RepID=UPI000416B811|nr:phosphatase PAP2 family protein [Azorhizobium doebereinerae]
MRWLAFFTLVVGAAVAILFTVFPAWDLAITAWFWDAGSRSFQLAAAPWGKTLRQAGNILPWVFAAPAFIALALKLLFPGRRMLMPARPALLLALSMAIGPGLMVNGILKEKWGRPRPVHVEEFGGQKAFSPWFSTAGTCPGNCSFVSGEGALGFWMVAPASLVPGPLRPVALGAAVAFGAAAGGLRIAFGGHFFTDVVFSGVLVILLILLLRWGLFDRRGAPSDAAAEAAVARTGRALHRLVALGARYIARGARLVGRWIAALIARYLPRRGAGL